MRHPYDVCFLDERLGSVAGIEVLCELRKSGCQVPVILLAESDGTEPSVGVIRAGAQECLSKRGLTTRMLENALKYVLERQPPALPSRGQPTLEELVANLESGIGPSLEAARAALACVLAEGYLAPEQREQLGEARELCRRALNELDEMVSITRPA
jgi:DNA-binding response OmpR family regulator